MKGEGTFMKYGHFDNDRREYVIDRVDLPTSWTNYLGLERLAVVMNHTAGGYSFYKSPEYHRISRFHGNSIPMDRPGYYVYIRDNEATERTIISASPGSRRLSRLIRRYIAADMDFHTQYMSANMRV